MKHAQAYDASTVGATRSFVVRIPDPGHRQPKSAYPFDDSGSSRSEKIAPLALGCFLE